MNTHSGPICSHMRPPIMGAGMAANPKNRPSTPLHLPKYSLGISSGVMELTTTPAIILNPKRKPASNRYIGAGERAKRRFAEQKKGVRR